MALHGPGINSHVPQRWVETQLSLSWRWEHMPTASLGIGSPLSPSGPQLALAITRDTGSVPTSSLGGSMVATSPWALLALSIGGEERERAKQHQAAN